MNHFFALALPPETTAGLAEFVEGWKMRLPREITVQWSEPENYHLTLNFLGDISRKTQPRLIKAVNAVPKQFEPFRVHLSFSGTFGDASAPSVLWSGLNEKRETTRLSKNIDAALAEQGFAIGPHTYVPHITLGRCRSDRPQASSQPLKTRLPINLELPVNGFVLMETLPTESRANGTKARYNTVQAFPFGNGQSSDVS